MRYTKPPSIVLRIISITNYKGIDSLTMEFPALEFDFERDITAIGGRNGYGKTSLLECSALLLHCFTLLGNSYSVADTNGKINYPDLLIRSGSNTAEISGIIDFDEEPIKIEIIIHRDGTLEIFGKREYLTKLKRYILNYNNNHLPTPDIDIESITGFSNEIFTGSSCIFFHSYRKVSAINPDLASLVNSVPRRFHSQPSESISELKIIILNSILKRAELLEVEPNTNPNDDINTLNTLIHTFSKGRINDKMKPELNNTIDLRISMRDNGEVFSFNALSSGQKEIISTLFLIWYYTQNRPMTVLIDEPELHLNAEWHRKFVNHLVELAPQNQYIIATHSVDVYDSAPSNRRFIIGK